MSDSDDSDYVVEDYVMPDSVRHTYGKEDLISDHEQGSNSDSDDNDGPKSEVKDSQCVLNQNADEEEEDEPERPNKRFILYVTNLSGDTTRSMLEDFFGDCGAIKSIRIPKVRLGCFAFVEMQDFEGFKKGLKFNNRELDGKKIQVYEGSKNKKHTSVKNKNLKRKTQQEHLNNLKSLKLRKTNQDE